MIRAEFSIDAYKGKLGQIARMSKNPQALMVRAESYMKQTEIPRLYAASPIKLVTGRLYKSIWTRIENGILTIGTGVKYGRILNRGGIIKAKNVKYLTIPLMENWAERTGFKARNYKNTFVRASRKTGTLILYQKLADGGVRALAALKPSVTIPAKKFLYWRRSALNDIAKLWSAMVAEEMKK